MLSDRRIVRTLGLFCAGACLFLGARWAFQHQSPGRLRELPPNGNELIAIRDGWAYFQMKEVFQPRMVTFRDARGRVFLRMRPALEPFLFHVMPVTGGEGRRIGEHRLTGRMFQRVHFSEREVVYFAYQEQDVRSLAWQATIPGTGGRTEVGVGVAPVTLYSMRVSRGAPAEWCDGKKFPVVISTLDAQPICIAGEKVYWIEIDPKSKATHAAAALKVQHRSGAQEKVLMTGLSPLSSLCVDAGDHRVLWLLAPPPGEYTPGRRFYRIHSDQDQPALFLSNLDTRSHICRPVTVRNRVYWKRDLYAIAEAQYQDHLAEIWSANLNGEDRRIEFAFETSSVPSQLLVHRGRLYFDVYEGRVHNRKRSGTLLMRLETDTPQRAREIFRLPPKTTQLLMDGDFLYYTRDEEREPVRSGATGGNLGAFRRVLYRHPLPP